jgi:predicted nuclease of predicted toxin-antitoxin system
VRLLADENFPRQAVEALRADGHDVLWVRTDMPSAPDRAVLACAQAETRVLVTFDKDFGELAFRIGLPSDCGVILFRIPMADPVSVAASVTSLLKWRTDWAGHFSVVDEHRTRMRPLPVPAAGAQNGTSCTVG